MIKRLVEAMDWLLEKDAFYCALFLLLVLSGIIISMTSPASSGDGLTISLGVLLHYLF